MVGGDYEKLITFKFSKRSILSEVMIIFVLQLGPTAAFHILRVLRLALTFAPNFEDDIGRNFGKLSM